MVVIINKERVRIGVVLMFLAVVATGIGLVRLRVHRLRNDPAILDSRTLIARSRDTSRRVEALLAAQPPALVTGVDPGMWAPEAAPPPPAEELPQQEQELEPVAPAPIEPVNVAEAIQLSGIAWSESRPLAFINGAVYAVGDEIAGFTVLEIAREGILVKAADGTEHRLLLYKKRDSSQEAR